MATSTLKILREVNDYTQDFVAEEILGISQATYARLEANPARITAEQAQKLSDLYKVSIANLLSEATPIVTFQSKSISENSNNGNIGFVQSQTNQFDETTMKVLKEQNELLIKQNTELMELVKALGGKLAHS
ncbi:helix-turn-helix domain-containing protein [Parafilimonas terrae]|uniref:Helix-turn-helix n=1 Tax=Parafilimonas terrae TaxID=1465490 RepID=A0A1I5XFW8_9BACT|nr:helix-turn-helix transcriptional regulator [Parafilimonas terrae]SFQ30872.1 Helix-turn-helix [Parafilimonas terrae]